MWPSPGALGPLGPVRGLPSWGDDAALVPATDRASLCGCPAGRASGRDGDPEGRVSDETRLDRWTELWSQDVDSCGDPNSLCNTITLTAEDAGGGHYLLIETARWSIDDIDEFAAMLKRFMAKGAA